MAISSPYPSLSSFPHLKILKQVRPTSDISLPLHDLSPSLEDLQHVVKTGLSKPQKELPPKLFYDDIGSQLYEQICILEEYYPTRTELEILRTHIQEIVGLLGSHCLLIEPGSGSGEKTRILLSHLDQLAAYVPIDISRTQLMDFSSCIARIYPNLEVFPVCADYYQSLQLPRPMQTVPKSAAIFFPGSTLGNLNLEDAKQLLRQMHGWTQTDTPVGLLVGVDLQKEKAVLEAAYNDHLGVTAAFNLNLLGRLNRELNANFDLHTFMHRAVYKTNPAQIEMRLVSTKEQTVIINKESYHFAEGEYIITEHSNKYTLEEIAQIGQECGWERQQVWTDPTGLFSVNYFTESKGS